MKNHLALTFIFFVLSTSVFAHYKHLEGYGKEIRNNELTYLVGSWSDVVENESERTICETASVLGSKTKQSSSIKTVDIAEYIEFEGRRLPVVLITPNAFEDFSSLNKVIMPKTISVIAHYAFSNCIKLTKIEIAENVTYISYLAFTGCSSLEEIIIKSHTPPTLNEAFLEIPESCTIVVPLKSKDVYLADKFWSKLNLKFVDMK